MIQVAQSIRCCTRSVGLFGSIFFGAGQRDRRQRLSLPGWEQKIQG